MKAEVECTSCACKINDGGFGIVLCGDCQNSCAKEILEVEQKLSASKELIDILLEVRVDFSRISNNMVSDVNIRANQYIRDTFEGYIKSQYKTTDKIEKLLKEIRG